MNNDDIFARHIDNHAKTIDAILDAMMTLQGRLRELEARVLALQLHDSKY